MVFFLLFFAGCDLVPKGEAQNQQAAYDLQRQHLLPQDQHRGQHRHQRIDIAEDRRLLSRQPDADSPVLAIATRSDLASFAYALTGARALRTAARLGTVVHVVGGILGLLIMAALAYLGNTELLTPVNILLYQLVWGIPGLLITEWTRTV